MNSSLDNVTVTQVLDPASLYIGIFDIIVSTIFIVVYIPTLTVMWCDKELMSKSVYNILVWDCVSDLLQVIGLGFVSGVMTLLNSVVSRSFNQFWGSLICISWLAGTILDISVALNRLISIHSTNLAHKFYGGRKRKIWIIAAWVYGLTLNGCYLAIGEGVVYDLDWRAWCFKDHPGSTQDIVSKMEIVQDGITQPLLFFICVAITIKLILKRRDTSSAQLTQKEKNAVYQVLSLSIMLMTCCFGYFFIAYTWDNKYKLFVGNSLWLTCTGWTPMVLLKFNTTLRQKVAEVFRRTATVVTAAHIPAVCKQVQSAPSTGQGQQPLTV